MKVFLKVLGLIVWLIIILTTGFYLVFNNLSSILATGKVKYQVERQSDKVKLKVGRWVETFNLRPPFEISVRAKEFFIKSYNGVLQITTSPKLKIYWKKLPLQEGE